MTGSIRLTAVYAGEGIESPHHLFRDVMQRVDGKDVPFRDHCWLNAVHGQWPGGIPHGTKVSFWATIYPRPGGARITEVRQVEVLE